MVVFLQAIIESLETHIRTLEHTLAHHSASIAQSKAVEEQLRTLIATLEREKRSKSYHILREIQEELTQDHSNVDTHNMNSSGNVNDVYKSKYVPFGATFPQSTFHSGVRSGLYSSDDKADINGSKNNNGSAVSTPPRRGTPERSRVNNSYTSHVTNNSQATEYGSVVGTHDNAVPRFVPSPSPIAKPSSHPTANDHNTSHHAQASSLPENTASVEYPTTPHHDFHYSDLQDTSVLDTSIDSYISSALFPPPADINWSQNDSFHTHYTGTDKDIHVSPSYAMPDPRLEHDASPSMHARRSSNGTSGTSRNGSGEKNAHTAGRCSDESENEPVSHQTTTVADRNNDHIHPPGKVYTMSSHSTRTMTSSATATTHKTRASDEIQAIYSDIGRLGSRLQTRLHRSSSPSGSVASSTNSTNNSHLFQGRK